MSPASHPNWLSCALYHTAGDQLKGILFQSWKDTIPGKKKKKALKGFNFSISRHKIVGLYIREWYVLESKLNLLRTAWNISQALGMSRAHRTQLPFAVSPPSIPFVFCPFSLWRSLLTAPRSQVLWAKAASCNCVAITLQNSTGLYQRVKSECQALRVLLLCWNAAVPGSLCVWLTLHGPSAWSTAHFLSFKLQGKGWEGGVSTWGIGPRQVETPNLANCFPWDF